MQFSSHVSHQKYTSYLFLGSLLLSLSSNMHAASPEEVISAEEIQQAEGLNGVPTLLHNAPLKENADVEEAQQLNQETTAPQESTDEAIGDASSTTLKQYTEQLSGFDKALENFHAHPSKDALEQMENAYNAIKQDHFELFKQYLTFKHGIELNNLLSHLQTKAQEAEILFIENGGMCNGSCYNELNQKLADLQSQALFTEQNVSASTTDVALQPSFPPTLPATISGANSAASTLVPVFLYVIVYRMCNCSAEHN